MITLHHKDGSTCQCDKEQVKQMTKDGGSWFNYKPETSAVTKQAVSKDTVKKESAPKVVNSAKKSTSKT